MVATAPIGVRSVQPSTDPTPERQVETPTRKPATTCEDTVCRTTPAAVPGASATGPGQLQAPGDQAGKVRLAADATRERPRYSAFLGRDVAQRLLDERGQQSAAYRGWQAIESREGPPIVQDPNGRRLSADESVALLRSLQRDRPVPMTVTVDGKPRPDINLRVDTAGGQQRRDYAHATTVPGNTDPNAYQLLPNASVDGPQRFAVRANPVRDRIGDAIVAAGLATREQVAGMSAERMAAYVSSLEVRGLDGFPAPLKDAVVREVIERGAFLRTNAPRDGSRYDGDHRWEISPVLALRGAGHPEVMNPWGADSFTVNLRTPPQ